MTKRVALIGHPVAHSLAGALCETAFEALGIDAAYETQDRTLLELADSIAALRSEGWLGGNVTIPYKERVVSMMDRLSDEAQATGAVDTITREGRRLIGHNTDVTAFRKSLDTLVGRQKMPKSAVLLGAGGGGRAVVYGLITEGFQRVVVFNRHLHRAENLVRHFARSAAHMELRAMPWHESVIESELAKTKLVVQTTSVGLASGETPIPAELIPPDLLFLDLIYTPAETRLLREAKQQGAAGTMNGDLMLLTGIAAAVELWTGQQAPIEKMRERLEAERARRDGDSAPAAPDESDGPADSDRGAPED